MIELRVLGTPELVDDRGRSVVEVLRQPKRLALLTYLVLASHRGFCRRELLLALLWPESSQEHARGALRQATYHLRKALGPGVVVTRGDDDLGMEPGRVTCDALELRRLLDAGRPAEAVELYQGDVLPGLFVADAPGLERWLDETRAVLRAATGRAALGLSREAAREGLWGDAVRWGRRAADILPDDDEPVEALMAVLEGAGDPAGALRAFRDHARRLEADLGDEPSAAIRSLAEDIRRRGREAGLTPAPVPAPARSPGAGSPAEAASPPAVPPASPPAVPAPTETRAPPPSAVRPRRRDLAVAASLLVLLAAIGWRLGSDPAGGAPSVRLAVTRVEEHVPGAEEGLGPMLRDMMAVSLARVPGLEVVSSARLYELAESAVAPGPPGDAAGAARLVRAAREAGAGEVLEGALYRLPDGQYRLELLRTAPRTGRVLGVVRVEAADPFALVDRATAALAVEHRLPAPQAGIADVTTRSVVAYRFYEEGLRAYYLGDRRGAGRMFLAALAEDSTFAMAAYYASMAVGESHRSLLRQALRFAETASDRERLIITAAWTAANDDPARLAVADTLAIRYPGEPDGHLWWGRAALADGRFLDAVPALRRVVVMDSLSLRGVHPRCRACEALADMVTAYTWADSLPAAERVARDWIRLQPRFPDPWVSLFFTLEAKGALDEALAALDSVAVREPEHWALTLRGGVFLRKGDFGAADRFLLGRMENGDPGSLEDALWGLPISLRHQGRFEEALELARRYRWLDRSIATTPPATVHRAAGVLAVLQDMGRHQEALALADSMASVPFTGESAARDGRARAWALTQAARSAAALGDTARLKELVDDVRRAGELSAYARDRRLHHHVRGLLLGARGDATGAARELRRALYSVRGGYVRTNLELGRALLAAGDAAAAVPVLEAAVSGPIGADGVWSTKTEIREVLASAYDAVGDTVAAGRERAWVEAARAGR